MCFFVFSMNSISVIIPNYNGKDLLKRNLPYVFEALKSSNITDYEVIISDDASSDDSITFLKQNYHGRAIILENSINVGFSGNVNRGIFTAKKDLVFILNSDVQLTQGFFIPLLKYFDFPDTFGVMSRIVNFQNETIDQAKFPKITGFKIDGTQNFYQSHLKWHPSFFLSGANALIDRKKIVELGGFLEIFNPFYYEDVDLGIRAWRKGYRCYYEHHAFCYHDVSKTIKKKPHSDVQKIILRNKIYLHFLHLSNLGFSIFFIKILFKAFINLLFLKKNYLFAFIQFKNNFQLLKKIKEQINEQSIYKLSSLPKKILNP